jgi:hypothetical protein
MWRFMFRVKLLIINSVTDVPLFSIATHISSFVNRCKKSGGGPPQSKTLARSVGGTPSEAVETTALPKIRR